MVACRARRGTATGVHSATSKGMAAKSTVTVADETCCFAHRSSSNGTVTMVADNVRMEPKARLRGSGSRLPRMTGRQRSAARRKRAAEPRRGGTYSVRVPEAIQVDPQTTLSAAKASHGACLTKRGVAFATRPLFV